MSRLEETSIPQVWGKNPIFAATRQIRPREVIISDGTVWRMGVEPPFGKIASEYLKGFDVRHAEVIFSLLAYFRNNDIDFHSKVDLSYYRLIKILGWSRGSKQLRLLKDIIADLVNIWTEIQHDDHYFKFRVLSASEEGLISDRDHARLGYIVFDKTFLEFLGNIEKFFSIRLDVFNSMSSGIAKAIYLYLPSRALRSTAEQPFRISLSNLYRQINITVEKYKSDRLKKLTQNKTSIIFQLDRALINFNRKLRIAVEESKSLNDYNLCAWTEEISEDDMIIPGHDSLRTWFINGNHGSSKDFYLKLQNAKELNPYETAALELAGINLSTSKVFLQQAKAVVGDVAFSELCGIAKDAKLSRQIKNSTAYFIALVKSELLGELPLF